MKSFNINAIALALGLVCGAGALAQGMNKADYETGKDAVAAGYKADSTGCASLSGNANDICMAQAKGKAKVARADLEASYKPGIQSRYEASLAKAEANHEVAKERCDDLAGNANDVCRKEAAAAQTVAAADAKALMKTAEANAVAKETTAEAREKASDKSVAARQDADADKLEAQYGVEKKKCDTFAGNAKDHCLAQAKMHFGKP